MSQNDDVLRSEFDLEFTYTRTYGDVMSKFFTELKDKKVLGIKGSQGQVICPPLEYDSQTSEELSEFVELLILVSSPRTAGYLNHCINTHSKALRMGFG